MCIPSLLPFGVHILTKSLCNFQYFNTHRRDSDRCFYHSDHCERRICLGALGSSPITLDTKMVDQSFRSIKNSIAICQRALGEDLKRNIWYFIILHRIDVDNSKQLILRKNKNMLIQKNHPHAQFLYKSTLHI